MKEKLIKKLNKANEIMAETIDLLEKEIARLRSENKKLKKQIKIHL